MPDMNDHYPVERWCSMDLPNLIEKFRTLYTTQSHCSNPSESLVDVIWTGRCPLELEERDYVQYSRTTIQDHLSNIKQRGWHITISPMEEDWVWGPCEDVDYNDKHIPTFVLRRKPIEDPLFGDDPSPYSDCSVNF